MCIFGSMVSYSSTLRASFAKKRDRQPIRVFLRKFVMRNIVCFSLIGCFCLWIWAFNHNQEIIWDDQKSYLLIHKFYCVSRSCPTFSTGKNKSFQLHFLSVSFRDETVSFKLIFYGQFEVLKAKSKNTIKCIKSISELNGDIFYLLIIHLDCF